MSKLTKLIFHPYLFFKDAYKKKKKAKYKAELYKKINGTYSNPTGEVPQQYYHEQILNFVHKHPVNEMSYKQELFWPFFRNELMIQLNIAWLKNKDPASFNPHQSQLGSRQHLPDYWRPQLKLHHGFVEIEDLKADKTVDFLFFTNLNSTDHVELAGKVYNRLLDPIMEIASAIGSVQKIEIVKAKSPALEKIKNYMHQPLAILPPRIHTSGHSSFLEYNRNFFIHWKAAIPSMTLTEKNFEEFVDWMIHMKNFYKEILQKFSPKAVFFHPYYYYTPLVLAAHELNVKTVDVQHGIQTGENPVYYDNWNEMPDNGYAALPDYFWVWGNEDKQALEQRIHGKKHKVIVGGYPWLEKQKKIGNPISDQLRKKSSEYKKVILVTLQLQNTLPEALERIINESPSTYLWMLRKHPKGSSFPRDGVLRKNNVLMGDEIDQPSLYSLLSIATIHMTESSTVVIEADYYGVKSIVWDKKGFENYKQYIEQKRVFYVTSPKDVMNVIDSVTPLNTAMTQNKNDITESALLQIKEL